MAFSKLSFFVMMAVSISIFASLQEASAIPMDNGSGGMASGSGSIASGSEGKVPIPELDVVRDKMKLSTEEARDSPVQVSYNQDRPRLQAIDIKNLRKFGPGYSQENIYNYLVHNRPWQS
jgi:hypothetical protein